MDRHAGRSLISFSSAFFEWFDHQEMNFVEYPYSRMDFYGDLNMVLPVGMQWSAIGKFIDQSVFVFKHSTFFVFSYYCQD